MDEFKMKINEYLVKFIERNTFSKSTNLEKKYEHYSETEMSYQCTMFYKSNLRYVLEFYMSKSDSNASFNVTEISLTSNESEIFASM